MINDTQFKNKLISCLPDNYESYKSPKRTPKRSFVRSPKKPSSISPKKLKTDSLTRSPKKSSSESPKKSPKRSNSKKDTFLNIFKFF
jgi:hypothetical protein